MAQAKAGDTVRVHYTGRLDDGTEFDSSRESGEPLQFKLDGCSVIPGFEKAVLGMSPGESAVARIPAGEAYGHRNEDLVLTVDRGEMPPRLDPQVGQRLHSHQEDGTPVSMTITEVDDKSVTLDANHPLAGKDLTFDIELVEIVG
ncbi:MAG: peptidylprolyl isomerase [Actinobacteria bacterium]|nr:peptidylprolyl isomerase [Actinomycetota bacterium]